MTSSQPFRLYLQTRSNTKLPFVLVECSPLLANLYLDPLDKELERRGYCFVRYADDCNVYVGGATAADRVVRNLPKWIAKHLRLKVNARKTGVGRPWERKFLGFRITRKGQIEVAPESLG